MGISDEIEFATFAIDAIQGHSRTGTQEITIPCIYCETYVKVQPPGPSCSKQG